MKLKGISIFEQHAEKAVLALFVIVAAVLFTMQFLNAPTVSVGGQDYPPEQLSSVIKSKAEQVKGRLEGSFSAENEPPEVPSTAGLELEPIESRFSQFAGKVAVYDTPMSINPIDPGGTQPMPGMTDVKFAVVEPPAPEMPVTTAEGATIDPVVPVQFPAARALLPDQQPLDEFYISAQTTWDAPAFIEALGTIPDDETINPMPRSWWESSVQVVDVIWERERLLNDGTWGERTVLDPLPGRDTLRELLSSDDIAPSRLPEILNIEAQRRAQIRRPDMYPIISGPQWLTPVAYRNVHGLVEVDVEGAGAIDPACDALQRRVLTISRRIEQARKTIVRLRERLNDRGNPGGGPDRTLPGGGAPGRTGMLPHPGNDLLGPQWPTIPENWLAQRSGPRDTGDDDNDRDEQRRARLERQIAAQEAEIVKLETQMAALCEQLLEDCDINCDVLLGRVEDVGADEPIFVDPALAEPANRLIETESPMTLWAHDLSVEPDQSYRYRATVVVINPFFGNANLLSDEQKSLAAEPTISSAAGDWSEPVHSLPDTYIRVVQASDASRPLPGSNARRRSASAQVEVYRFYYGYWRAAEVQINTGDQVVADIELPDNLMTWEVTEGEEGQGPTVGQPEDLKEDLSIESELVMAGVFESANRRITDVLFSTLDGRTRLASQVADTLWALIQRSEAEAETAVVLAPGSGPAPAINRPGGPQNRPGIPDRNAPIDRMPGRGPSPTRGPVPL